MHYHARLMVLAVREALQELAAAAPVCGEKRRRDDGDDDGEYGESSAMADAESAVDPYSDGEYEDDGGAPSE